jgi:Phytanoyl-CoA dioxygenase (PhyH)
MQISDPQFWLGLNPDLHIETAEAAPPIEVSEDMAARFRALIGTEGYLQAEGLLLDRSTESLAAAVKTLVANDLPTPFAFVYDEFWHPFQRLRHVLEQVFGRPYLMLPDFWVWHVSPAKAESGWSPHRDKGRMSLFEDGTPKSLTVWLPLTAATPLNGCLYLVPADRDPTYRTERESEWTFKMPDVRALPAKAGDLLMWNQAVLHWGAHASERAAEPRISMAFEFQRDDVKPFNQPLLAPGVAPGFDDRLKLICKQILQYQHMYGLSPEMQEMAGGIVGELARRRRA